MSGASPLYVDETADLVVVLVNPNAGSRSAVVRVELLIESLRKVGCHVRQHTDPHTMADEANRAFQAGSLRTTVAVGGDGTAAMVANATLPGVPITIMPAGTENLLAKYWKIPSEPESVAQIIRHGRLARMDTGQVGDRLFLIMASCGFDADVVRRLHGGRKGHINHMSYAKPILESMLNYSYPEIRLEMSSPELAEPNSKSARSAHWAFVFNLPSYASGLAIAPEADGQDGLLDVCTFQGGSVWHGLFHLSAVMLGQHRQLSGCDLARARHVRIDTDGKVPFQLDGDPGGFLPVEIHAVPDRLTLMIADSDKQSRRNDESPASDNE